VVALEDAGVARMIPSRRSSGMEEEMRRSPSRWRPTRWRERDSHSTGSRRGRRVKNQGGWGEISCRVPVLWSTSPTAASRPVEEKGYSVGEEMGSPVNGLDDGCLLHILGLIDLIPS
jgi:hypothetical protein